MLSLRTASQHDGQGGFETLRYDTAAPPVVAVKKFENTPYKERTGC